MNKFNNNNFAVLNEDNDNEYDNNWENNDNNTDNNIDNNTEKKNNLKVKNDWKLVVSKKKSDQKLNYSFKKNEKNPQMNSQMSYLVEKNKKKILCNNILNFGECNYDNKCLYAHTYDEQKIYDHKLKLYEMIRSNNQLTIDLSANSYLYKQLLIFTKICNECVLKKCPGGYNCKYGIFDKKYQLCFKNLYNGSCTSCGLIHLTKRGLKPFINEESNFNNNDVEKKIRNIPECKVIDSDYLNDSDIDSIDSEVEKILNIDETDNIDPCELSIFREK